MTDKHSGGIPPSSRTLSCRDKNLDLSKPVVMGILNTTPDSFSDGGKFISTDAALARVSEMAGQGASIIDIGGESTRPGSDPVSVEEEISRTFPILTRAIDTYPELLFSIDTTKYEVAKKALSAGVHIINDVSGLKKEPRFAGLCVDTGAAYVCMHSQGDPKTMQNNPTYKNVVENVLSELMTTKLELNKHGVDNIIMDPGIGFGKTTEHNLSLIANLPHFLQLNCPLMIGASRKSLIGKLLNGRAVDDRLAGTIALHYHCLMQGALILRVHDVQEAADSIDIFNAIQAEINRTP
ncbi:dihydropteroate synthase [Rhodohalobacter sp. 8-1]|uniref:dihydropteroate synthase n=1 Tax=Rhodohalobacter sp. 8-1 TaxID=3131972 RepID=UPI0030EDB95C